MRDLRKKACAERLFIVSLFQTGGSRVTNLGHPAHPRPKGTGDHNLPEKRGQATSASRTPRVTRVAWSRLHCLKSNPDRDTGSPAVRLTQRGVTACRVFVFCNRRARPIFPPCQGGSDGSGRQGSRWPHSFVKR